MKKIIGITGGIGSGKSTVAHFITEKGFPVYNSDYWAKELVNLDSKLKEKIIQLLGNSSYDNLGNYNRKWVSEQVFGNDELLKKLNQIIHPAVAEHFENWVKAQKSEWVFKESALLYELGIYKNCYQTILVTADDNIRIKRVMNRDQKTYREVEAVLQKQMPEKDKIKLADHIIYNNSTLDEVEKETLRLLEKIQN
ncbi:dephospho-CoA kinase [Amniculibacterium aquaticum]|uniref:dephospho-CoA kinase n=1 Tax=Amniculibacterium aquaticum TaxID=2479858 RepID=UPI000F5A81E9|nr:dephospho-CoA kinase [Amniculibacterium aquaticum]